MTAGSRDRRVITLLKLSVLAAIGFGLYALWHKGVPPRGNESDSFLETEVAVHVGKIARATLRHGVSAYGTVEAEPGVAGKAAASAQIKSPVAAIVAEVNCVEGQQVEKGQALLTLNNIRKPDGSIDPTLLKITAPLSGTVVSVNVRPGEVTDPETITPLIELVDLHRLVIAAHVPSSQLSELKSDQTVEIFPAQSMTHDTGASVALVGAVTFVEDRVDPKTDMGVVDISVGTDARLRPGQFVRVRIITEERPDCLTVPSESVVKNEAGESVIILVNGKQAIQQPVQVGFREGDRIQVQSLLLQPGDKVVTTGAYGLPAKTKIRILSE